MHAVYKQNAHAIRGLYEFNIYTSSIDEFNIRQGADALHLPEARADRDALRVDEGGQLRRRGLVRDLRPRQAAAAAHGADLPHLQ